MRSNANRRREDLDSVDAVYRSTTPPEPKSDYYSLFPDFAAIGRSLGESDARLLARFTLSEDLALLRRFRIYFVNRLLAHRKGTRPAGTLAVPKAAKDQEHLKPIEVDPWA